MCRTSDLWCLLLMAHVALEVTQGLDDSFRPPFTLKRRFLVQFDDHGLHSVWQSSKHRPMDCRRFVGRVWLVGCFRRDRHLSSLATGVSLDRSDSAGRLIRACLAGGSSGTLIDGSSGAVANMVTRILVGVPPLIC